MCFYDFILLTVFAWFHFLVCINYFLPLLDLIILEVWLIVCLELRFWFAVSSFTSSSSPSSGGIGGKLADSSFSLVDFLQATENSQNHQALNY